jgi:hypothetical protein
MKVWLNNLKEGDIFYHIMMYHIYKCKHLGDAHNMNFRMPRIKYEIIEGDYNKLLFDIFGDNHEVFVNQYVYDDYESALEELRKEIKQNAKSVNDNVDEPITSSQSTNGKLPRTSTKKQQ